jgi:2'-5' RNA ligase
VRLFVAFEIPAEIRGRIAQRVEGLRATLPPASWVPEDRLHLTLEFLGEVDADRVAAIGGALRAVFAETPSMRMRLGGAGTFPPGRPARVAWVAVDADGDLAGLERRARGALEPVLGIALEGRPYHAHVTVARPRRPWTRGPSSAFSRGLEGLDGAWEVARAVLMESHLDGRGARYEVRQEYPLGPTAPATRPA